MRNLITLIALFFCLSAHAQFTPFAGLELFSGNSLVLEDYIHRTAIEYKQGDATLIYGLGYRYKDIELKTSAETSMYLDKVANYTPTHTEFKVSGAYYLDAFHFKIEHTCLHPLQTYEDIPVKIFGGYTKIGIYWNYKP